MRISHRSTNPGGYHFSWSRVIGCLITCIIVLLTAAPVVTYAEKDKDKNRPEDEAIILQPIGSNPGGGDLDGSLIEYLRIAVYQRVDQEWVLIKEYTSELSGSEDVRLAGNHYQVNWHEVLSPNDASTGKGTSPGQSKEPGVSAEGKGSVLSGEYRIVVSVAGMEIENFDVVFTKDTDKGKEDNVLNERGSVPLKVAINDDAGIRARVLTEQGYTAPEIALLLQKEFALGAGETAQLLYNENHSAQDVGLALKEVYNLEAEDCAAALKSAGFAAEGTAKVLATTYGLLPRDTGQIMTDIDYTIDEIYNGLKAAWAALTTGDIITLFKQLSYTADKVIFFLYYGLEWTVAQVLDGIYAAEYWVIDAAEWLWHGLGWTGGQIIAGLKAAGYFMEDIGQWLWDGLGWTGEQIVAGLTAVGYALEDVGQWFYSALNYTAEGFAYVLDALGYTADAIVSAMSGIWSLTEDGARYILTGLGYAVDFIDDLLGSIFGTVICTELHRQGYLSDEVYAADVKFGLWMDKYFPQVINGYHFLAGPPVSQMQQSKSFTNAIWFFAKPWSEEMAYMTGVSDQENFGGALLMVVGIPLCFIVGIFVTFGYPSLAALILLLGIAYMYRKGYLTTLNINHGRFPRNLRPVIGHTQAISFIALTS